MQDDTVEEGLSVNVHILANYEKINLLKDFLDFQAHNELASRPVLIDRLLWENSLVIRRKTTHALVKVSLVVKMPLPVEFLQMKLDERGIKPGRRLGSPSGITQQPGRTRTGDKNALRTTHVLDCILNHATDVGPTVMYRISCALSELI
jgi:hypothetical protein